MLCVCASPPFALFVLKMASMDLSLDDIIKKKFTKNPVKGKGGFKKFPGNNVGNNRANPQANAGRRPGPVPQQRRLGAQNAFAGQQPYPPRQIIGDARNRIIQKKRMHLTDARDKLCEIAKQTDARQKLEKLRERRGGPDIIPGQLGYNGYRGNLKRPMRSPVGIPGRPGLVPALPHIALQRTISQPVGGGRFHSKVPALMDMDIDMHDDYIPEGPLQLCRTVNNDQMRAEPLLRPSKLSSTSPYSWKAPPPQPRLTQSSSSRGYIDLDYPAEARKRMKLPSPPPMMRPILVSDDEDMVEPVRPRSSRPASDNPLAANKSRLESSRIQASSAPSGGSSGYRIVVSNLQTSVTHEDIRELFEDVGPLVASRLVRPGTAEVVYRQFKDAERAVENYHNRQLDGQPMKCLLVKPRPSTASAAQPSGGSLRGPVASSSKLSGSGKSSVVPDISTIHKALFNKA